MGGLPTTRTVNGFAVDPANPKVMYAARRDGLFKSTDGGVRWLPVERAPKSLAAVTVNPKRPEELYAATMEGVIHRSRDGGNTWERRK